MGISKFTFLIVIRFIFVPFYACFSSTMLAFADNALVVVVAHSCLLVSLTMMCEWAPKVTSSCAYVSVVVYSQS